MIKIFNNRQPNSATSDDRKENNYMENNKDEYLMIDHTIKLDVSKLPKLMQNTIADLEEYEKKGEWVMYDGLADGL